MDPWWRFFSPCVLQGRRISSLYLMGSYHALNATTYRHYYDCHFILIVPHSDARHCLGVVTVRRVTSAEISRVYSNLVRECGRFFFFSLCCTTFNLFQLGTLHSSMTVSLWVKDRGYKIDWDVWMMRINS